MPGQIHQSSATNHRRYCAAVTCGLLLGALTPACDSPPRTAAKPPGARPAAAALLAAARIDLAASRLAANAPEEALALVISALQADPQSAAARAMAGDILSATCWHLPELTLDHPLSIDHIDFAAPSSLWVSLSGAANTTVRWNLDSQSIESVLFPLQAPATRSMEFDPTHRAVVIERAGVALLCNAQSLKPIRNLGPLPEFVTPSAAIVFATNGLLVAHPAFVSATDHALVWHLRDAASGEIIRSSEPVAPDHPRPLAAFLDHHALRVLHADGSMLEMPLSPVEPIRITAPAEPLRLLHAQIAANGGSALALKNPGPHRKPETFFLSLGGAADSSLEPAALLERFPWSRQPGLWTDLLGEPKFAALEVADRSVRFPSRQLAPIHTGSAITAIAASGDRLVTGEMNGTLTIHRTLPVPLGKSGAPKPAATDEKSLAALRRAAVFLAGVRLAGDSREFTRATTDQRLQAFKECDFDALHRLIPELNFSPLVTAMHDFNPRSAGPGALLPLTDRLARATLAATDSAARISLQKIFMSDAGAAITAAIQAAGGKGAAAAAALEFALASTHP